MREYKVRVIRTGFAQGTALKSDEPISFFGCVDPETGVVVEKDHPLEGESIKDRILVFPEGKGSTVGSYSLYRMKKNNTAPRAIINRLCEPIVAVGAIISDIPCVDGIDISKINSGDKIIIREGVVFVNEDE
ncbi:MAG: hypothetical protein B6U72_05030 [Candidatus Altiarchaeales archaeon ex4484_2]|nr:MAG: hypothetical protein B6U72_05030 [Candidatus Altiarchaeales archaeon ex4484_2]